MKRNIFPTQLCSEIWVGLYTRSDPFASAFRPCLQFSLRLLSSTSHFITQHENCYINSTCPKFHICVLCAHKHRCPVFSHFIRTVTTPMLLGSIHVQEPQLEKVLSPKYPSIETSLYGHVDIWLIRMDVFPWPRRITSTTPHIQRPGIGSHFQKPQIGCLHPFSVLTLLLIYRNGVPVKIYLSKSNCQAALFIIEPLIPLDVQTIDHRRDTL